MSLECLSHALATTIIAYHFSHSHNPDQCAELAAGLFNVESLKIAKQKYFPNQPIHAYEDFLNEVIQTSSYKDRQPLFRYVLTHLKNLRLIIDAETPVTVEVLSVHEKTVIQFLCLLRDLFLTAKDKKIQVDVQGTSELLHGFNQGTYFSYCRSGGIIAQHILRPLFLVTQNTKVIDCQEISDERIKRTVQGLFADLWQQQAQKTQITITTLQSKIEELEQRLKIPVAQISLQPLYEAATQELEACRKQLHEHKMWIGTLRKEHQLSLGDVASLRRECEKLYSDNSSLEGKLRDLRKENEGLKKQVEHAQKQTGLGLVSMFRQSTGLPSFSPALGKPPK